MLIGEITNTEKIIGYAQQLVQENINAVAYLEDIKNIHKETQGYIDMKGSLHIVNGSSAGIRIPYIINFKDIKNMEVDYGGLAKIIFKRMKNEYDISCEWATNDEMVETISKVLSGKI